MKHWCDWHIAMLVAIVAIHVPAYKGCYIVIVTSSGLISKPVCVGDAQPIACPDADVGRCGSDCVQVRGTGRERCLECNTECKTCCSVENVPLLVDTLCKDTASESLVL